MDEQTTEQAANLAPRRFYTRKKEKKDFIDSLRDSSGFIIGMGALIATAGMITFMGFHNQISKFMLDIGFITFFLGMAVKIIDVGVKIIGERK